MVRSMIDCDPNTVNGLKNFLISEEFFLLLGIIFAGVVAFFVTRSYVNPLLVKFACRKNTKWVPVFKEYKTFRQVAFLIPALFFITASQYFPTIYGSIERILEAYIALNITLLLGSILRTATHIYELYPISKEKPIKSYIQLMLIIIYILGGIVAVCQLTDTSPTVFLGGAVAIMAAILLVFRDTILSFIASMQLAANNLIRKGDWIEVKPFGADGYVIDIALHVVRVQNFDKTIVTIPTYKIMESGFRNWRGMFESGGRRIKKSILIDQTSIRFMEKMDLDGFYNNPMIKRHLPDLEELYAEHYAKKDKALTNLGILRTYLTSYLRNHPQINQDYTLLVRILEPTPDGIPLQIYTYTSDTRWAIHEQIQADIFEHLIALLGVFDLRVFQNSMDTDFDVLDRIGHAIYDKP